MVGRVGANEHFCQPTGKGVSGHVSIVKLSIYGCDIGGFSCLSPCKHLHLSIALLLDPNGDHFVTGAGGDSVGDIALIANVPFWDGDGFPFLPLYLACKM